MDEHRSNQEWTTWPINWSAIWVGALTALAVGVVIGLIALAVGAHEVNQFARWKNVRIISAIFGVCGAFFSMVAGGWVAARIAGIRRAENAMLIGGVVWALTVPLLVGLSALGAASHLGAWYGGLAGSPPWSTAVPSASPDFAAMQRNAALAAVVSLLVGLAGSAIGGWMAAGEPMSLTYYRRRGATPRESPRIAA